VHGLLVIHTRTGRRIAHGAGGRRLKYPAVRDAHTRIHTRTHAQTRRDWVCAGGGNTARDQSPWPV